MQIDLFGEESNDTTSLLQQQAQRPVEDIIYHSFVRNAYLGAFENESGIPHFSWIANGNQELRFNGRCTCKDFQKNGKCEHQDQLIQFFEKDNDWKFLGENFNTSPWFTIAQSRFHRSGLWVPQVKLPDHMILWDQEGNKKMELRSPTLGKDLMQGFYGFTIQLPEEALRRLRIPDAPDSMLWKNFFGHSLTSQELHLLHSQPDEPQINFERSLNAAFFRHLFFHIGSEFPQSFPEKHQLGSLEIQFY